MFFDAYGANGLGQFDNLVDAGNPLGSGATTFVRSNNSVGYFLPKGLGGLYGQFQVSAQEGGITPTYANKYKGGRLGFASGPFDVGFGYGITKTATADDYKLMNIGASYDMGVAKVLGLWNVSKYGAKQLKTYGISAAVPMGQGEFKLGYVRADASGAGTDDNDANQLSAQYIYNLSKRTALYTTVSRISNKGKATFVMGGAVSAADAAAGGFTSQGYNFGIRHSF